MTFFELLEVGARLDIGVTEDGMGEKRLFLNEITRWPEAYDFSHNILLGTQDPNLQGIC
ncbi:hypothetical protein NX059_012316 [Plenodomus lindquistii]|nr:hypothetical protein NX059_012316 [Plenodomus lindquistii]